ncbi:MAG TPA: hypothetical protein DEQ30_12955, partial [Porphyromonadaceae bacterium]|nr:hypothetical protein [Porphyromonadaceae bacterium]
KSTIDTVLLHSYITNSIGIFRGKAGVSIILFELASYLKDASIEEHAFELLQETFVYDIDDCGLLNGKAGISYALNYLIKSKLLEADYFKLYVKQHKEIIEKIKDLGHKQEADETGLDYYFFINTSDYISYADYQKYQKIVTKCILNTLEEYECSRSPADKMTFYMYITKVISVLNNIGKTTAHNIFNKIDSINNKLIQSNWECTIPLLPIQLSLYSHIYQQKKIIKAGKKITKEYLSTLEHSTLGLRYRIDLIIALFRLYTYDNDRDYISMAYKLADTLIDRNIDIYEKKLAELVFTGSLIEVGLGSGLCRLLMLHIYWNRIGEGIFPSNFKELSLL